MCNLCLKLCLSWNIPFKKMLTFDTNISSDRRSTISPALLCDCFVTCILINGNLICRETHHFLQCCAPFFANCSTLCLVLSLRSILPRLISWIHFLSSSKCLKWMFFFSDFVFRPSPNHFDFPASLQFPRWDSSGEKKKNPTTNPNPTLLKLNKWPL